MKRQRSGKGGGEDGRPPQEAETVMAAKRRARRRVEKGKQEAGEGRRDEGEKEEKEATPVTATATATATAVTSDEWLWMGGGVDEQMSWGYLWLPFWDLDCMGEAYGALFNDVVWDDDIWNLRASNEVPAP